MQVFEQTAHLQAVIKIRQYSYLSLAPLHLLLVNLRAMAQLYRDAYLLAFREGNPGGLPTSMESSHPESGDG